MAYAQVSGNGAVSRRQPVTRDLRPCIQDLGPIAGDDTMSTREALVTLVSAELRDPGHALWSEEEITMHLRSALHDWSRALPRRLAAVIPAEAGRLEYDLAVLADLMEVTDVWYPYDAADPPDTPLRPPWSLPCDGTLRLQGVVAPLGDGSDDLRVFYTAAHTIEGLDGAAVTTLDAQGERLVVLAASAHAALQASQAAIGTVTVTGWTPKQYAEWAALRLELYRRGLDELCLRAASATDARVVWG